MCDSMPDLWVPDYLADNEALEWSVVDGMVDWSATPIRVWLNPQYIEQCVRNGEGIERAVSFKGTESNFDGWCDG